MAPTICSGKKRQTRTIATTSIRRHGQGPHQLNQAFSNIVNFVAKGSRAPASLRIQTHNQIQENLNTTDNFRGINIEADLIYNFLIQTSATSAANHRFQNYSFITDNAVTSSAPSDTENTLDLRLANEILGIDTSTSTTTTYGSNNTNTSNTTSLSSSSPDAHSFSSHKEKTSSPTTQRQEKLFQRFNTTMQKQEFNGHTQACSDNEEADLYENDNRKEFKSNKKLTELHSSYKRERNHSCNDFNSDEDEKERVKDFHGNLSGVDGDSDMETDETDSMTSLDTEKSAKLKQSNNPLLSDKLFAKHLADNNSSSSSNNTNNNTKSTNSPRNTAGLLSIAIKTIKLVKRNQLLQQRLTQLQLETTEFIQSVLANPENRHFRENIKQKV